MQPESLDAIRSAMRAAQKEERAICIAGARHAMGGQQFAEAGGLLSDGANIAETCRRSASFVDKLLKGSKPQELPIERPTRFEFVVNLKTAKQIGLTVPPNVLAQADRVIK